MNPEPSTRETWRGARGAPSRPSAGRGSPELSAALAPGGARSFTRVASGWRLARRRPVFVGRRVGAVRAGGCDTGIPDLARLRMRHGPVDEEARAIGALGAAGRRQVEIDARVAERAAAAAARGDHLVDLDGFEQGH